MWREPKTNIAVEYCDRRICEKVSSGEKLLRTVCLDGTRQAPERMNIDCFPQWNSFVRGYLPNGRRFGLYHLLKSGVHLRNRPISP